MPTSKKTEVGEKEGENGRGGRGRRERTSKGGRGREEGRERGEKAAEQPGGCYSAQELSCRGVLEPERDPHTGGPTLHGPSPSTMTPWAHQPHSTTSLLKERIFYPCVVVRCMRPRPQHEDCHVTAEPPPSQGSIQEQLVEIKQSINNHHNKVTPAYDVHQGILFSFPHKSVEKRCLAEGWGGVQWVLHLCCSHSPSLSLCLMSSRGPRRGT